jgi:DNA-binding beta-propeller fold protein YncE
VGACGLCFLLGSCSTRERLNPLDPKNSKTQGGLVGFNAIAADHNVEFRWPALFLEGVRGYRVQRWIPGGFPQDLGAADYGSEAIAGEDTTAQNHATYVYRLIVHLTNGDSAASPPDTATPGTRQIFALEAGKPAFARLSPDARDLLYVRAAHESYLDMELDRRNKVIWLSSETDGFVLRRSVDGATVGMTIELADPTDISVSSNRGVGWVISASDSTVSSYSSDVNNPFPQLTLFGLGHPRVVEAGTNDPTVWVGNEEGTVHRFRAQDLQETHRWFLPDGVRAIALDEGTGGAWVVTRTGESGSLYYLNPSDSSSTLVKSNLLVPTDLATDPVSGDVWMSERGTPHFAAGRLSLITRAGVTLATVIGIEPYGIDVDPLDRSCWVSELRTNRILQIDRSGATVRASAVLDVPYAVRVDAP